MGGALGLRAARCEPFGRGLSGAAREQPATVGVCPARTVGGVLWGPRGTRTAHGRGVRPPGSGTRQLNAAVGVAPSQWKFDAADWWLEEHGLIMEKRPSPKRPVLCVHKP